MGVSWSSAFGSPSLHARRSTLTSRPVADPESVARGIVGSFKVYRPPRQSPLIGFRADLRLSPLEGRFALCQDMQASSPDKELSMKGLMKTLIGTFAVIALGTALAPTAAAATCFQQGDGGQVPANGRSVMTQSRGYL